jgi:hypothetical protein
MVAKAAARPNQTTAPTSSPTRATVASEVTTLEAAIPTKVVERASRRDTLHFTTRTDRRGRDARSSTIPRTMVEARSGTHGLTDVADQAETQGRIRNSGTRRSTVPHSIHDRRTRNHRLTDVADATETKSHGQTDERRRAERTESEPRLNHERCRCNINDLTTYSTTGPVPPT